MRKKTNESPSAVIEKEETTAYRTEIEDESLRLLDIAEKTKTEMDAFYPQLLQRDDASAEAEQKAASIKRATSNITKALAQTYSVGDELSARHNDIQKQKKKRKWIAAAPANAVIDLNESCSGHFARGMNLYKLLLICFIGSFIGVVIEMLWCLVTNGYIESRAGLVYGPFNLLYGVGAVALTVCLYRFRNHGSWISFLGGMIVGSVVEYICSLVQEVLFGSRSWDYSHMPFNLGGRVCLLYSVFWGLVGVLWIKDIYPRIAKWILKIPNRGGKIVTWMLVVFFAFNACMSAVSMYRWSRRVENVAPANAFEVWIDERFPNERMQKIYANMEFTNLTE